MKHILSLSLSLCLLANLSACGPIQPGTQPTTGKQTTPSGALSVADINTKADTFDMMLLTKGANGVSSPITPERLESLSIDGKTIAASSIVLPGASAFSSLASEQAVQLEASKVIQQNKALVIFGDNGVYTFVVPRSTHNNKLEFKLKGDAQTYQLIRVANLNTGTFILDKGQIQGAFNLRDGFKIKPTAVEYSVMLALILVVCITATVALGKNAAKTYETVGKPLDGKDRDGYYDPNRFNLAALANFYQSNPTQVTVTTQDNQKLVFTPNSSDTPASSGAASSQEQADARTQVQTDLGDYISPLTSYVGSWTLDSDFVKAVIPGGSMVLDLSKTGKESYRLSATLASGSYAGEGSYSAAGGGGGAGKEPLTLSLSSGGKNLEVKFRLVYPNVLGATLLKADGTPELSAAIGQEITFKRNL